MVNKSWFQILRCFRERPGGVCFASSPKKTKNIHQISGIHVQSWHSGSLLSSWSKYLPSLRGNGNWWKLPKWQHFMKYYEITYYQCAACIVSHHETSFSGWLIPTNAWRQLAKGSHTTSLARANHACDKKHRLGSANSQQSAEMIWDWLGWATINSSCLNVTAKVVQTEPVHPQGWNELFLKWAWNIPFPTRCLAYFSGIRSCFA